jgi:hypothetical protein
MAIKETVDLSSSTTSDEEFASIMRQVAENPEKFYTFDCAGPYVFVVRWHRLAREWGYSKGKKLPKNLWLTIPASYFDK